MPKRFVWGAILLLLCACLPQAFAMGEVTLVTKETQVKLGLNFTLVAERVDAEAVLVRMEIARKGKLKNLRSVSMRIGQGHPRVAATLHTSPGKNGSWVLTFQVAPALSDAKEIKNLMLLDALIRVFKLATGTQIQKKLPEGIPTGSFFWFSGERRVFSLNDALPDHSSKRMEGAYCTPKRYSSTSDVCGFN